MDKVTLKSVLTLFDVFFVSLGYIVGAGIYSLIYMSTKHGGKFTWLSFIIGGLISLMTGLSYAELSKHYDTNASEFDYITKTITNKFSKLLAIFLIISGIVVTATLALAFSNLFYKLFKIPFNIILFFIVLVPTIINIIDVKLTTNTNMKISMVESSTLILLILLSIPKWKLSEMIGDFDIKGITYGAFLTILAFSGYESIPKLAEETQDSKINIPKAIIWSLTLTIIMYTLTSISINSLLGTKNVMQTINPITKSFELLFGNKINIIINIISLFSIFNTVMLTLLFTSRQLYGISKQGVLPKFFSKVNSKTRTPIRAIIFVSLCVFLSTFIKNIEFTNHISNLTMFIIFLLVNLSAIILRKKQNKNISINSILGLVSSLIMIVFTFFR